MSETIHDSPQSSQNSVNEVSSDPLFISNSDNPTHSLVATVFDGSNFVRWSRNLRRALGAKNKEGFINGSLPEPESTHKDFVRWRRADHMVASWILSSMTSEIADDFQYIEQSFELWREICERFGQTNGLQFFQLKKDLMNLKQDNQSVLSYYGKVKRLWDEMQSLRKLPQCSCGALLQCTCQFLKRLGDFENDERLMQFLLGLNPGFDTSVTNILSVDPLPTLNRAFSIAQQVEKQKELSAVVDVAPDSSALIAHRSSRFAGSRGGSNGGGAPAAGRRDWRKDKLSRFCDHCKMKGHNMDQCFKIIGFPDWYNAVKSGKSSSGPKMAANVTSGEGSSEFGDNNVQDSPLDSSFDTNLVQTVCQEVIKAMKGNSVNSYVNFAGPI